MINKGEVSDIVECVVVVKKPCIPSNQPTGALPSNFHIHPVSKSGSTLTLQPSSLQSMQTKTISTQFK